MDKNNINKTSDLQSLYDAKLSDTDFDKLSKYIQGEYGIKMPPEKRVMLQSRLQKRLRALNIASYSDYVKYAFGNNSSEEIIHMIDVVSTNKTDFFREPSHFDFMKNEILPEFYANSPTKHFKVWSAGCSSGEEPYTIAMVLSEFALQNASFDYSIFGTDISTIVLKKAFDAIYPLTAVDVVSLEMKKKYLLKSKKKGDNLVRVIPTLRNKTKYGRLNFMAPSYNVTEMYDLIFCRNVLIYFDRDNQERVINKLCENLKPGGYFFLGHSESITGIKVPLKHIQPTVFRKL